MMQIGAFERKKKCYGAGHTKAVRCYQTPRAMGVRSGFRAQPSLTRRLWLTSRHRKAKLRSSGSLDRAEVSRITRLAITQERLEHQYITKISCRKSKTKPTASRQPLLERAESRLREIESMMQIQKRLRRRSLLRTLSLDRLLYTIRKGNHRQKATQ